MQRSLCDVKHLRAVNAAIVIDLLDDETVGEGRDVQHVEQRGLAGTNLVTEPDQADITLGKGGRVRYRWKNWFEIHVFHECAWIVQLPQ